MAKKVSDRRAEFLGFSAKTFQWLRGLEKCNTKEWFEANKETYLSAVREPLESLLTALSEGRGVKLFRQNRDVRFSADKSPYKTNCYGVIFPPAGSEVGLYVELSAKGLFVGSGMYQPATDQLARYRGAVDAEKSGAELERIVQGLRDDGFAVFGDALATVPRGYPKDHPRAALLARKDLLVGDRLDSKLAADRDAAYDHVVRVRDRIADLVKWMDKHVGMSTIPPEVRWGRGRK